MAELRVARDDAEARLLARLSEGEELLVQLDGVTSDEALDAWAGHFQIWNEYNSTLLAKVLASEELVSQYHDATVGTIAVLDDQRLSVELPHRRAHLNLKQTALESLVNRLPLFDEPRAPASGTPLENSPEDSVQEAVAELTEALSGIDRVIQAGHESAERTEWNLSTDLLLVKLFGADHQVTRSYRGVSFQIPSATTFTGDPTVQLPRLRAEAFRRGMVGRRGVLRAAVDAIERGGLPTASASVPSEGAVTGTGRDVFVVHGRDLALRDSLFALLNAFDLHPMEWSEAVAATGDPTPYIGEVLDKALSLAQAVVVLLSPDDEARLREPFRTANDDDYEAQLLGQARPNVIFEAGMGMGRAPNRVVLVQVGSLRPFSDVAGRHILRLSNDTASRQQLAERLQNAGCPVSISGTRWHTVGDFSPVESRQ